MMIREEILAHLRSDALRMSTPATELSMMVQEEVDHHCKDSPKIAPSNSLLEARPKDSTTTPKPAVVKPKVHSNRLANRFLPEFASYAEHLQNLDMVQNRKITFQDEGKEINIPAHILQGEREIPVLFLLDTGAQRSFISERLYQRFLKTTVKKKVNYIRMYGVGGNELATTGEIELDIQLGEEIVRQRFIVADIKEDGILGFDFCRNHQAEWRWQNKELTLAKNSESVRQILSQVQKTRVVTGKEVIVPDRCEILISGILEHASQAADVGMVEPQGTFLEKYQLGVAAVLAERRGNSIPVRLINTTDRPIKIYKNTPVAQFSPAEIVDEVRVRQTQSQPAEWDVQAQYQDQLHDLDEEQKERFYQLLHTYQAQFMTTKDDIGRTNLVQHTIHTGDHIPIKQKPRREPIGMQGVIQEEIKKMEEKGVIEPSNSPWASPVVLVRKKDGSVRFCIDYRKLNSVTSKDAYPLPRIDDNLDALRGARWFSTLDLASGYWQVEMAPEDREKTAFCTKYGLHQFRVMPFGLCNAPGTFERLMETVLRGMQWERAVLYLDDIIIFSDTIEEHMRRLEEIFLRLKKANLTLKPSKCHFFQRQVEFLGHIVDERGISTDPAKVEAVTNWEIPKRVRDVRAFLGLTGYYRRFIHNYGQLAKPLHELTEKNTPFIWTKRREEAFRELKRALIESPILGYPSREPQDTFILDTDASNCHLGAVLSQRQDGQEKVIAYGSKVLSKAERNYCVTRRELLAVVHFVTQFKHYLLGRKFIVRTDHGALTWLFQFKEPEGQLARWLELLSPFDIEIIHRPGRVHSNGDAMSRKPCPDSCPTCKKYEIRFTESLGKTMTDTAEDSSKANIRLVSKGSEAWQKKLKEAQDADPHIRVLDSWKEKPNWNEVQCLDEEVKVYWSRYDQLRKDKGCWKYQWKINGKIIWKWVIPISLRHEILEEHHNHKMAGHFGVDKTIRAIHQSPYYWPLLLQTVQKYVQTCITCQRTKPALKLNKAPLGGTMTTSPMERIAVDVLGPLPVTETGHKYIVVVADYFTKWMEAFPTPNHKAHTIAKLLVEEIFMRFGLPTVIHSDQGRDFESKLFAEMCSLMDITKTRTTPWHAMGNGMVERHNRTLETLLKQTVNENQKNWDQFLPYCTAAYRSSVHSTTGQTPNMLMLGRELPRPSHLQSQIQQEPIVPQQPYNLELMDKMQYSHKLARDVTQKKMRYYKRQYNKNAYKRNLQRGDWVWLHNPTRRVGLSPKIQCQWEREPYRIVSFLSELVIEIQQHGHHKKRVVHVDKVKKCADQQRWAAIDTVQRPVEHSPPNSPMYGLTPTGLPCRL